MQEIELKFLVPEYKVESLMRQANIKSSQTEELAAHYFDTPTQTLAKNGIALRIRKEDEDWVQTIKATIDGMAARLEHNQVLDKDATEHAIKNNTLVPDLSFYAKDEIADVFTDANMGKLKTLEKKLTRQYLTDVQRIKRWVKKDDNMIEVAYDEGQVIHGKNDSKRSEIHEIEFELIAGDSKYLFEVAKTWCKRYKLCLSTVTKAERGSLLLADKDYNEAVKSDLNQLNMANDVSQAEFMRQVVHNCMLQILPNASAIAAGSPDGNHVHQLRVGIRRLRTALKFFDGFNTQVNPDWTPILKQTFSLLGEYRDREILAIKTQPMLEQKGAPQVDWSDERDNLAIMPIDAVRANDFQVTLLELIEFSMQNSTPTNGSTAAKEEDTQKPAKKQVRKIIKKLFEKISVASENFADLDIDAQHDVRKRLKSLRYICEFAAPMYKKKATKQFLRHLEPAQDVLGEYNDSMVGHEFYLAKAKQDPNAWFAVGYFNAKEDYDAKICAEYLKTVKQAPIFW